MASVNYYVETNRFGKEADDDIQNISNIQNHILSEFAGICFIFQKQERNYI